jgi:hypothetical protein
VYNLIVLLDGVDLKVNCGSFASARNSYHHALSHPLQLDLARFFHFAAGIKRHPAAFQVKLVKLEFVQSVAVKGTEGGKYMHVLSVTGQRQGCFNWILTGPVER